MNVVGGVSIVGPEHSYPCVLRLVATMIWPLPSFGGDEDFLELVSSFGDGVAELHVWRLLVGGANGSSGIVGKTHQRWNRRR